MQKLLSKGTRSVCNYRMGELLQCDTSKALDENVLCERGTRSWMASLTAERMMGNLSKAFLVCVADLSVTR